MLIKTVGQLKEALSQYKDETKVGIDDTDEGSILEITKLFMEEDLLLIGGSYNNRIATMAERTP